MQHQDFEISPALLCPKSVINMKNVLSKHNKEKKKVPSKEQQSILKKAYLQSNKGVLNLKLLSNKIGTNRTPVLLAKPLMYISE